MATWNCNSAGCLAAQSGFNSDEWLGIGPAGHLFDGLTYLLQAAQERQVQTALNLQVGGYQATVYSMDSVFLRARTLYEFFVGTGRNYCHAKCLFGFPNQLTYAPYTDGNHNPLLWESVLHVGSMHLQNRAHPITLTGHDGSIKDLNEMTYDFAQGILDVWSDFENELKNISDFANYNKAKIARQKAEEDSRSVAKHAVERVDAYKNADFSRVTALF